MIGVPDLGVPSGEVKKLLWPGPKTQLVSERVKTGVVDFVQEAGSSTFEPVKVSIAKE